MRLRFGDTPAARFVKLHVAVDAATGEVLAHQVTEVHGRGTGDVSVGPWLIGQAAARSRAPTCVLDCGPTTPDRATRRPRPPGPGW